MGDTIRRRESYTTPTAGDLRNLLDGIPDWATIECTREGQKLVYTAEWPLSMAPTEIEWEQI